MEHVVLLSGAGDPIGTAPKATVHGAGTPLHLAFSCYLFDGAGRILLTRRALTKQTWPGVWTNSFCGHPGAGEAMEDAVRRHARRELGVEVEDLRVELPHFRYRAVDPAGIVENEVCPVYRARTACALVPDPDEVMDLVWVEPDHLTAAARLAPWAFSPWLTLQLEQLHSARTEAVA